ARSGGCREPYGSTSLTSTGLSRPSQGTRMRQKEITHDTRHPAASRRPLPTHWAKSLSNARASFNSSVSNPSVNHPYLLLTRNRERTLEIRLRFGGISSGDLSAISRAVRRTSASHHISFVVSTAVIASPIDRQASSN